MTERIEEKNAIIKRVTITDDDHGLLSAWVHLEYPGGGQGFGGYALYLPSSFENHNINGPAGHFIWRVMEVAGVHEWGCVPGKTVRVRASHDKVHAIGHIINDDWFCPADDFRKGGDDDDA